MADRLAGPWSGGRSSGMLHAPCVSARWGLAPKQHPFPSERERKGPLVHRSCWRAPSTPPPGGRLQTRLTSMWIPLYAAAPPTFSRGEQVVGAQCTPHPHTHTHPRAPLVRLRPHAHHSHQGSGQQGKSGTTLYRHARSLAQQAPPHRAQSQAAKSHPSGGCPRSPPPPSA